MRASSRPFHRIPQSVTAPQLAVGYLHRLADDRVQLFALLFNESVIPWQYETGARQEPRRLVLLRILLQVDPQTQQAWIPPEEVLRLAFKEAPNAWSQFDAYRVNRNTSELISDLHFLHSDLPNQCSSPSKTRRSHSSRCSAARPNSLGKALA